jgi:hypothetical protein
MKVFAPLLLGATLLFAGPVLAEEGATSTPDTNNEILMQKITADKKLLVASNMDLTDVGIPRVRHATGWRGVSDC